jgi:AraC-like DNA-binding protein
MATTFFIKNMVCNRCITAVTQVFDQVGLHPDHVTLGEVTIPQTDISPQTIEHLDTSLVALGFERIDDRRARLIESIKNTVIRIVHNPDGIDRKFNWSHLLSEALHYEYNYLSNLFSSVEGITLEHYIIRQKIERVKELLFYDELSLSEIAHTLGYSSVAHLSGQFKKVTGLTPSELKKSRESEAHRKPLDKIA